MRILGRKILNVYEIVKFSFATSKPFRNGGLNLKETIAL